MQKGIDPSKELGKEAFENTDILFTSDLNDLHKASFHIVAVPTPIDKNNLPDLGALISASEIVGKIIKRVTMLFLNQLYSPGLLKKSAFLLSKNYRA